jgi:hypothetical protein
MAWQIRASKAKMAMLPKAYSVVKEHLPPRVVLVIYDNPYGLMFASSYICRTCP